jgi:secreted PhoX family phosphatase
MLDRRRFLRHVGVGGTYLALDPALGGLIARMVTGRAAGGELPARSAAGGWRAHDDGYGPLVPQGPELALPEGFQYRVLGVEGSIMADGTPTPRAHDGMASFRLPNGNIRLIRNHEDRSGPETARRLGDIELAYDEQGGGGTTSLEIRLATDGTPEVARDFLSLGGTIVNCAGGPTPWSTWLSCEESIQGKLDGWSRPHGYVFEVPVGAESQVAAVPLPQMGRFVHEAAAVDPATGIVYLTEDAGAAGFYRFLPAEQGRLAAGGRLQMLMVEGHPGFRGRLGYEPGRDLPVRWLDIPDPDPDVDDLFAGAVFSQGYVDGAAMFSRLEGCWYGNGAVYFQATDGGAARAGQVWRYRPSASDPADGGVLSLVFESPDRSVLNGPDNLTVSPRGGLLICEDGSGEQYLRGLTPEGGIFDFARNMVNDCEFAGATFDPDGRILFVNIQGDTAPGGPGDLGMTLAIGGPWEAGPL